ncbi:MAG: hypothetical protein MUC93_13570 [Bacteroidales bacterium]|jgi:hypothetical protein|nr:hypothetical protein [Bacteroidales bacterium]
MIIVLFIISTIFNKSDTNLGLFIYIILPGFFLLGLIMIPFGMVITGKKQTVPNATGIFIKCAACGVRHAVCGERRAGCGDPGTSDRLFQNI